MPAEDRGGKRGRAGGAAWAWCGHRYVTGCTVDEGLAARRGFISQVVEEGRRYATVPS